MELDHRQYRTEQYNKEWYGIRTQTLQYSTVHDVVWNQNTQYSAVQYNKERYRIRAQTLQCSTVHDMGWNQNTDSTVQYSTIKNGMELEYRQYSAVQYMMWDGIRAQTVQCSIVQYTT